MDIVLSDEVNSKLWAYVDAVHTEIAAWGYVKPTEAGDFYVYDVFLVPQTVSSTEVDFVSDGLPYAVEKAMNEGKIDELRFCFHSHVNMGTGFSGTDEDMIRKVRDSGPIPWLVNVILNKKGESNGRLDIFKTGLHDSLSSMHHLKGIELGVCRETVPEHTQHIDEEIKQHVRKQTFPTTTKNGKPDKAHGMTDREWQQAWTSPSLDAESAPLTSHGETSVDWNDVLDPSEMSKSQLEYEIAASKQMHELGITWDSTPDSDGYIHWFDHTGHYQGMCMGDELLELAEAEYAIKS